MKAGLDVLSPTERQVAVEFARRVRQQFGDRILAMKVFGSRARREARADSDFDIWVLVDRVQRRERERIIDIATDMLLEDSSPFYISPRVMSVEQYDWLRGLERLLPQEIERDGIDL
jgi:predicted nucleotidyltransferase